MPVHEVPGALNMLRGSFCNLAELASDFKVKLPPLEASIFSVKLGPAPRSAASPLGGQVLVHLREFRGRRRHRFFFS
jgi:hypothetical protein